VDSRRFRALPALALLELAPLPPLGVVVAGTEVGGAVEVMVVH
jgi:hypothetical protein